jgi:hypothetical protein
MPGYQPRWRIDLSRYLYQHAWIERDNGNDTVKSGTYVYLNVPPMPAVAPGSPAFDLDRHRPAWSARRP